MDFQLTDEQKLLRNAAREFFREVVAPLADEAEEKERFPRQLFPRLGQHGYLCVRCPAEYGGAGLSMLSECLVREELSFVSQGIASAINGHAMGAYTVLYAGTEEQRRAFLPSAVRGEHVWAFALTEPQAGSDVKAIRTTAQRRGGKYVLNGRKTLITNAPIADFFVVAAYTDRTQGFAGISLFVVPRDTPGLSVSSPIPKEGYRASETGEIALEDCELSADQLLGAREGNFAGLLQSLTFARVGAAASCIGVARAALEAAIGYSREREQFGRPIAEFQAIRFQLAAMATQLEAARWLTWRAAWLLDQGAPATTEASMAKWFAAETAVRITEQAIRIHGGYGSTRAYRVGRYHRDALVLVAGEGTAEIQLSIIAKGLDLKPSR